ncbi:VCBS repeat-containing protein [Streptomyces sp. P5-A9]|uniref:VCBS repeat-containing protein n=1 Tax=Streptomyces sp. P5-A9 TaxID=3071730 RepID=UPI002FC89240
MTSSGVLVADLNGDGTADHVSPPSRTGADLALTFGAEDGGRDTKVGPRDLVGNDGEEAEDVLAVVADFDQDGWNDLFIVATDGFSGDSPLQPAVSDLRLGPFSASGRGQSDHHVQLSEPRALAVADYNNDRYPDLASYGHSGDGVYTTMARLGSRKGLDGKSDEINWRYSQELVETSESMPRAAPTTFHPACVAGAD